LFETAHGEKAPASLAVAASSTTLLTAVKAMTIETRTDLRARVQLLFVDVPLNRRQRALVIEWPLLRSHEPQRAISVWKAL
jgi:hypothetical protein